MNTSHNKKRTLTGTIVSDAMQKTRVIVVHRQKKHPKYLRYYQVSTKFKAHDENNEYKKGDVVTIAESRPLSKTKRWKIVGKINKPDAGSLKLDAEQKPSNL